MIIIFNKDFTEKLRISKLIPKEVLYQIIEEYNLDLSKTGEIEIVILFGIEVKKFREAVEKIGVKFEELGYSFGIIKIKILDIPLLDDLEGLQYFEFPKPIYTADYSSNRASCVQAAWNNYGLSGEGVLVGFIDTGIDYTHPAFKDTNGKTRIEYIYDLENNKIYDKDKINEALQNNDPYSIVPTEDIAGHGSHVAGIACAGGNIDFDNYGVAYKSSIIMVKITREKSLTAALSTQLMRGLKFLIDKSKELKMPLVINISLSTNDGAHNGSSLLEQYIQTITRLEKVALVVAAGNDGASGHHIGGTLERDKEILFNIGSGEKTILLDLYKPVLIDWTINITSPAGISTQDIVLSESYKERIIGNTQITIYTAGPKPFDITGQIIIKIAALRKEILPGEWKIFLKSRDNSTGYFDIWLPITEGLNEKTRFLQPDPFNTLGIPATVAGVISVGSYNYNNNSISPFSGRGVRRVGWYENPDLLAPGENILSVGEEGGFTAKSGTSMAAPHVAGICALLLEWGIVRENDIFLYGDRLKYYLIKGAKRNIPKQVYPNPIYGYGFVCAEQSIELLENRR
ncbi:S8 family serine peptidase [Clostridium tarantellae]|uniref:S8 family serine peptidase n=1 Tax=Clostridium tarantellae TaxID=39493 RepID=A0A6I1MT91_9CLOT|nr:S8 family serine peptidase [Clostridium tarantellae]MPQ43449.1 S8 family serine peptidase [Clostridium tarantellae]